MNTREQQLLQMGFKKNKHQQCFHQWKHYSSWLVDFRDVYEPINYDWECFIENLKYQFKQAEKALKQEELYVLGFNSAQKEFKKQLLDKLNHYKSNLQDETKVKLNRLANKEKIREIEIRIETIKELMK